MPLDISLRLIHTVSDAVNVVFGYIKKMQLAQKAEGTRQALFG